MKINNNYQLEQKAMFNTWLFLCRIFRIIFSLQYLYCNTIMCSGNNNYGKQ